MVEGKYDRMIWEETGREVRCKGNWKTGGKS